MILSYSPHAPYMLLLMMIWFMDMMCIMACPLSTYKPRIVDLLCIWRPTFVEL